MTITASVTPSTSAWTRQTIYSDPERTIMSPNPDLHGKPAHIPPRVTLRMLQTSLNPFTPAFTAALRSETLWMRQEHTSQEQELAIRQAIESGQPCPACSADRRWAKHRGRDTNIEVVLLVGCECELWKRIRYEVAKIPERFRDVRLEKLTPKTEKQAEHLPFLRQNPTDSYFLHGAPGTGKTHIMYALHGYALEESVRKQHEKGDYVQHIWRVTASVLLNEHVAWDTRDVNDENCRVDPPSVTTKMVDRAKENGYRPCLFIDEIDKLAFSEFKIKRLGEIINAIYEANGQIVATSNKDVDTLIARWGSDDALTIIRRIGGGESGHILHFAASAGVGR